MLKSPEHLLSNDDQRLLPLSFPSPQASKQHENPKQPLEGRRREDVAVSLWVGTQSNSWGTKSSPSLWIVSFPKS